MRRNAIRWMVGLMAGLMVGWIWTLGPTAPIRYVRVEGWVRHLDRKDLEQVLRPLLADGYWGLDVDRVTAAVKQLVWVDKVRVERIWPDVLGLEIQEQEPYVRWGETDLLNRRGERFTPATIGAHADLPWLNGPDGYERRLFRAYRNMAGSLRELSFQILRLEVDARRSWHLTIRSGDDATVPVLVVLGRQDPQAAFARVMQLLVRLSPEQRRQIGRLDARYEHGFAVRWRGQTESSQ